MNQRTKSPSARAQVEACFNSSSVNMSQSGSQILWKCISLILKDKSDRRQPAPEIDMEIHSRYPYFCIIPYSVLSELNAFPLLEVQHYQGDSDYYNV
jgi:hypothetical protein